MSTDNERLIAEAQNTRGYSEGDLRSLVRSLAAALSSAEQTIQGVRSLVQNTDGDWLDGEDFEGLAGEIIAVLLGTSWILPQRERNLAPSAVPTEEWTDPLGWRLSGTDFRRSDEPSDSEIGAGWYWDPRARAQAVAEHPTGGGEQP